MFVLQALLCSHFVSRELCDFALSNIEGQRTDLTSVSLLCLPHVDRHTEVSLFMNTKRMPKVTAPGIRQLPSCRAVIFTQPKYASH